MTPQQHTGQDTGTAKQPKSAFRVAANFALAGAIVWGGPALALYSLFNGVTFTRSYEGHAEHVFKDGTHRSDKGRGFSFTNPFAVAETTKWEYASQTLHFNSDVQERDKFRAEVKISYVGPENSATYYSIRHQGEAAGNKALKDIFQKNRWASYASVDPATEPQNAAALCKGVTSAVAASLDPKLEQVRLGCDIKVDVPFKGYTAKVS